MKEEKTYQVRIEVTESELQKLGDIALLGYCNTKIGNEIAERIVVAHAEQNLSVEREAEIKAALGVE